MNIINDILSHLKALAATWTIAHSEVSTLCAAFTAAGGFADL